MDAASRYKHKRRNNAPTVIFVIIGFAMVVALAGAFLSFSGAGQNAGGKTPRPRVNLPSLPAIGKSAEQRIVLSLFAEKLPDPDYQIVRWGDPYTVRAEEVHKRTPDGLLRRSMERSPSGSQYRCIRVKYRTKNPLGGPLLLDEIMWIQGSRVVKRTDIENQLYKDDGFFLFTVED